MRPRPNVRHQELLDLDRYHMTRKGWLPRTNFAALEELRERHEALIEQRDAVHAERSALEESYAEEDRAHAEALEAAYRDGTEPDDDKRTPDEDRRRALADADARSRASARVVLEYAYDVLDRLRGPVPEDWQPHLAAQVMKVPPEGVAAEALKLLAEQERAVLDEIEEARRVLAAADLRLREFQPLKVWFVRNGNGSASQILPGNDLPIPERHTAFTKPEGAPDPADWPRGWAIGQPEVRPDDFEGVGQPEALDPVPAVADDEEGGYYELPDEPPGPTTKPLAKVH